jgi:hypothetical protein
MKTAALFVLLLAATLAPAAPAPDDYSINVHVTSSYIIYAGSAGGLGLDVVINAKKYQLGGDTFKGGAILALGDYKAKLVKDEHPTAYETLRNTSFSSPTVKPRSS